MDEFLENTSIQKINFQSDFNELPKFYKSFLDIFLPVVVFIKCIFAIFLTKNRSLIK